MSTRIRLFISLKLDRKVQCGLIVTIMRPLMKRKLTDLSEFLPAVITFVRFNT